MTNPKRKGSKNERSVAKIMRDWSGYEFARTPQSGGLHWKKQHTSGDIVCIDEKHGSRFPFSIECKFHEDITLLPLIQGLVGKKSNKVLEFWKQTLTDAQSVGKVPLLFMRKNGMKKDLHFVVISQDFFNVWLDFIDGWKCKSGMLFYADKDYQLAIINSDDLLETDYWLLYKAGKKLRRTFVKVDIDVTKAN